jgi:hypothetical protein
MEPLAATPAASEHYGCGKEPSVIVWFPPASIANTSSTAANIAVNMPVKVDGFFDAEGVLVAAEIDFL